MKYKKMNGKIFYVRVKHTKASITIVSDYTSTEDVTEE